MLGQCLHILLGNVFIFLLSSSFLLPLSVYFFSEQKHHCSQSSVSFMPRVALKTDLNQSVFSCLLALSTACKSFIKHLCGTENFNALSELFLMQCATGSVNPHSSDARMVAALMLIWSVMKLLTVLMDQMRCIVNDVSTSNSVLEYLVSAYG